MPRMGRTVLPYYPHHIIQRGHTSVDIIGKRFSPSRDFERYLETLAEFK